MGDTDSRTLLKSELNKITYESNKKDSNIPQEYFSYSLADYNYYVKTDPRKDPEISEVKLKALTIVKKYIDNIDLNLSKGRGLFIFGPKNSKCGITLLGTYVLREALRKLKSCCFVEFPSFVLDLWYSKPVDYSIEHYYNKDFLMLDSIDAFNSMKNTKIHDTFSDIVFYRKQHNKPIIFSSYDSPNSLTNIYSKTILNYIDQYCDVIDLTLSKNNSFTISECIRRLNEYSNRNQGKEMHKYTIEEIVSMITR